MLSPELEDLTTDWETYPVHREEHTPLICEDADLYRRRLIQDSPRLFASEKENFELLRVVKGTEGRVMQKFFNVQF
jgi:hypothetical protein